MSADKIEHLERKVSEHGEMLASVKSDVHTVTNAVEKIGDSFEKLTIVMQALQMNNAEFAALIKQNAETDRRDREYLEDKIEANCRYMDSKVDQLHEAKEKRLDKIEKRGWAVVMLVIAGFIAEIFFLIRGG